MNYFLVSKYGSKKLYLNPEGEFVQDQGQAACFKQGQKELLEVICNLDPRHFFIEKLPELHY